jgi:polar amino acid transport system substrate-binding protein
MVARILPALATRVGAAVCLLLGALPVAACTKTVRFEVQPPYGVMLPTGERGGYYIEVVREALARIGCRTELVEMPWPRGLRELEEGRLDLMPGMLLNRERRRYAHFSRGINLSPNLLFLSADASRRVPLRSLADLRGTSLKIAVETGAYYSAEYAALLTDARFAARLHIVPSRETAWRMLRSGRVDGVMSDQSSALVAGIPLTSGADDVRPALVLSSRPARVAFSRRTIDAAFVERFDAAIDSMIADGMLARLRERYVPCTTDPATLGCRVVVPAPPDASP